MAAAVFVAVSGGCDGPEETVPKSDRVEVKVNESASRVDVSMDHTPFTSYIYADPTGMLKKPVLYPILTASGTPVTRGFPLDPVAGERADHPHQVGSWMNHGVVNGLDFWNNSGERSAEEAWRYGTIRHSAILTAADGETGILEVSAEWLTPSGDILLDELTRFEFGETVEGRYIDRTTTWRARGDSVVFEDSKEGMMAIRVARGLELPTSRPDPFVGEDHSLTEPRVDSSNVTGWYLNSNGLEGNDVWGRRAEWVVLNGTIGDEPIALAILDHPENVGFPTHWMARDYGLFAANPLGARVYSDGAETLDFTLEPESDVTFRYRLLIHSGSKVDGVWMQQQYENFVGGRSQHEAE